MPDDVATEDRGAAAGGAGPGWSHRRLFELLRSLSPLRVISISGPSVFEAICDFGPFGIAGGHLNAITDAYHLVRIEELRLTADFLARKEEEKEAERAEKERLREETRARKEFEAEKARLFKEHSHYATALERIRQTGSPDEVAAAEAKLAEIGDAIHGVEEREANIRAGYVYVISNVGAFGPNVVKIGMTRRLDPTDRIRELGDASVPFRYDTHALVFSEDAVSLENRLHHALAERRLNLVNQRREFFYATPTEVKALLTQADGSVLEFIEEPEADEWHQSENARRHAGVAAAPQ